jgi:hypothetical protein
MDEGDKMENVLVTGYAKLPQGITAAELYTIVGVALIVDRNTGEIKEVDCTLVTTLAREFVKKIILGGNINVLEPIEAEFERSYLGSAKKALISALRTCGEKYRQINLNEEL